MTPGPVFASQCIVVEPPKARREVASVGNPSAEWVVEAGSDACFAICERDEFGNRCISSQSSSECTRFHVQFIQRGDLNVVSDGNVVEPAGGSGMHSCTFHPHACNMSIFKSTPSHT